MNRYLQLSTHEAHFLAGGQRQSRLECVKFLYELARSEREGKDVQSDKDYCEGNDDLHDDDVFLADDEKVVRDSAGHSLTAPLQLAPCPHALHETSDVGAFYVARADAHYPGGAAGYQTDCVTTLPAVRAHLVASRHLSDTGGS